MKDRNVFSVTGGSGLESQPGRKMKSGNGLESVFLDITSRWQYGSSSGTVHLPCRLDRSHLAEGTGPTEEEVGPFSSPPRRKAAWEVGVPGAFHSASKLKVCGLLLC